MHRVSTLAILILLATYMPREVGAEDTILLQTVLSWTVRTSPKQIYRPVYLFFLLNHTSPNPTALVHSLSVS